MIDLKGVILAAGEGRRCRPLTQTRSKVMLPVGNRPIMEHVIAALAANGIQDLYIVVGYQKERIMDYFEDGLDFGVKITYLEQNELLGTAHALRKAEPYIDEAFLVVNGDNLIDARAVRELISAEGENVILAALRRHTGDYGVLMVEQERVKAIIEKPGRPCSGIINTGAYRFSPSIFEELRHTPISERGSYELTETISQMIAEGKEIVPRISQGIWADAIFAWDLLNANNLALNMLDMKISGELEEGVRIKGPVYVGEGSIIRSGSYLVGPVSIGEDCDIGPGAVILPTTSIGDSSRIGPHAEIRNSIIMNDARIGSAAIISDSVVGASTTLSDQVVVESGPSVVEVEEAFIRAEFGAIIADDVTVGSRALASAGTVVGTGARIGSGSRIRGCIERESRVVC
ncbi:MAG TPA: sugar phosphate nucleotidyltransferase [Methanothrix sp.]|nr:NTP transferase domain-containing protein [Methanothrix sp.]HOV81621.1 sugar phosphate nucleotidyltransferase [Methanothrix sp.]HPC88757.1 sugar phosphate nucleotidyltransferase [Methanothrix sp.]HRS84659.1 sugar phosphate nucleotidyltransferase [Methanothrix sp.]HRT16642.1 sugar phosphate nucleotidyltransferase [Methanothrix sp.]